MKDWNQECSRGSPTRRAEADDNVRMTLKKIYKNNQLCKVRGKRDEMKGVPTSGGPELIP